jgi:hypothetical protein
MVGLLFPPGSCVMGFTAVSCAPSTCFCCPLVRCVVSFFPFWVLVYFDPSSSLIKFLWVVLGFLGTRISGGYVSAYAASPSVVIYGTFQVMPRILHSLGHSLMTMSISPSISSSASVDTIYLDHSLVVSTLFGMWPGIWRCLHIV